MEYGLSIFTCRLLLCLPIVSELGGGVSAVIALLKIIWATCRGCSDGGRWHCWSSATAECANYL